MAGATFGQLQKRVADRLIDPNNTAVSAANVAQAINDAVAFWKTRKFYFNQRVANLTLDVSPALDGSAPGDPFVLQYGNTNSLYPNAPVLPADFLFEDEENGFTIPYNNLTYNLDKQPPKVFDDVSNNGVGLPYIYTFRNGNYEIYFLPQTNYTLRVNYICDYAPLVNATDTNDFTTFADKLIEYDAISRILSDLRLDDDRAARFSARCEQENANLKSRSAKQNATGKLTIDTLLT